VGASLAIFATVVNVLLAMALRSWLQAPAGFQPLTTPAVASLTIIGMIAATVVFAWTARTQPDPIRRFLVIATLGLFLSWLPDLAIWVTGVFHGTTGAGILSLMTLHLVAAGCAVAILTRFGLR
jgi:predicted acyltransferase